MSEAKNEFGSSDQLGLVDRCADGLTERRLTTR